MKVVTVVALLTLSFGLLLAESEAYSQKNFQANFVETKNPSIPNGKIPGVLYYDYSNADSKQWKYRVDWTVGSVPSTVTTFFQTLAIPNTSPQQYQPIEYMMCGSSCNAQTLTNYNPMTMFYQSGDSAPSASTANVNGQQCFQFNKSPAPTQAKQVASVWVLGNSGSYTTALVICRVVFKDGTTWDFDTTSVKDFSDASAYSASLIANCPAPSCNTVADIILVQDMSGSILPYEVQQSKTFGQQLIQSFVFGNQGVNMGYVMYDYSAVSVQSLTNDQTTMLNAVLYTSYRGGSTCSLSGLTAASNMFNSRSSTRYSVQAIVIMITDGDDNCGYPNTPAKNAIEASTHYHSQGIIITIGVGSQVNNQMLQDTSSTALTGKTCWFTVSDWTKLQTLLNTLMLLTCSQLTTSPCGANCNGFCACNGACLCPGCVTIPCKNAVCSTSNPSCQYTDKQYINDANYSHCRINPVCNNDIWTTQPLNCDDGNACTTDTCVDSFGCKHTDISATCGTTNNCGITQICFPTCGPTTTSITNPLYPGQTFQCKTGVPAINGTGVAGTPGTQPTPGATVIGLADAPGCATNFQFDTSGGCACTPTTCPDNPTDCFITTCQPISSAPGYKCVDTPMSCDTGTKCATSVCVNGACTAPNPIICDDNLTCTIDTCNATSGCVHTLMTANMCDDFSNCTVDYVNCSNLDTGCSHYRPACPLDTNCTKGLCLDATGQCLYLERQCSQDINVPACYQVQCLESAGGCFLAPVADGPFEHCGSCFQTEQSGSCGALLTVAQATGLAAGILALIIIAAIVGCLLLAAGGGKAGLEFYKRYQTKLGDTHMNPMYKEKDMGGENPLYER